MTMSPFSGSWARLWGKCARWWAHSLTTQLAFSSSMTEVRCTQHCSHDHDFPRSKSNNRYLQSKSHWAFFGRSHPNIDDGCRTGIWLREDRISLNCSYLLSSQTSLSVWVSALWTSFALEVCEVEGDLWRVQCSQKQLQQS